MAQHAQLQSDIAAIHKANTANSQAIGLLVGGMGNINGNIIKMYRELVDGQAAINKRIDDLAAYLLPPVPGAVGNLPQLAQLNGESPHA